MSRISDGHRRLRSRSRSGGRHVSVSATSAPAPNGSRTTTAPNGTTSTRPASTTSTHSAAATTGSRPTKAGHSSKAPANAPWSHPTTPATPRTSPRIGASDGRLRRDRGAVGVGGPAGTGMVVSMNAREVLRRARRPDLDLVVLADREELLVAFVVADDDSGRVRGERCPDGVRVWCRVFDREGRGRTVERGEATGDRARVLREVAHGGGLGAAVRIAAHNQCPENEDPDDERAFDAEVTVHALSDAAEPDPVPSAGETVVDGAHELLAAGIALVRVEAQLVHHVAEAEARVGVGERQRPARAGMAEDRRRVRGAERGPEHEAAPE